MNVSVEFAAELALTANSLILTALTLRTFSVAVSDCVTPLVGFFQETRPARSPLNGERVEVTLNVALTVAPGAIGPEFGAELFATAVHPFGVEMLNLTSVTSIPVVFLNVTVVSCEEP